MFTADDARNLEKSDLDERIEHAVKTRAIKGERRAYLRVYSDDPFCYQIEEELVKRGFHSIDVPAIYIKGDVEFGWGEQG